jgi:hypothetical protein
MREMNRTSFIILIVVFTAVISYPVALASVPLIYSDLGSALLNATFFTAIFAVAAAIVTWYEQKKD